MRRYLYSLVLMVMIAGICYSQNTVKKWYVNVGTFAVDHTSVRGVFDGYFDVKDWSATPFGKLTIGYNLNRSFNLDLQGSVGEIDNKRLNYNDEFLTLVTLGAKYNFANDYILKQRSWFDPYLRLGFGYHSLDYDSYTFSGVYDTMGNYLDDGTKVSRDHIVASLGAGMNFWIKENFGFNIESQYVHCLEVQNDYIDFFQHSAGLAFRFGPNDRDKDGILDNDDECPDTPGLVQFNGCPDTDGDGLEDRKDECPETPGPIENIGCPYADADGDGWLDMDEECDLDPCKDGEETDEYYCFKGCKVMKPQPQPQDPKTILITFEDVLFDFDKATLKPESDVMVQKAYDIITNTDKNFVITGHTDNYGSDEYNEALGRRRAQSVANALIAKGINGSRLTIQSAGETQPKCTNDTDEGRQCNRRVEIRDVAGESSITIEVSDEVGR